MTIYADLLFLINFLMDIVIIHMTGKIVRKRFKKVDALFAAFCGSIIAIIYIYVSGDNDLNRIIIMLITAAVMSMIIGSRQNLLRLLRVMLFVTAVIRGFYEIISNIVTAKEVLLPASVILCLIIITYISAEKSFSEIIYEVQISCGSERYFGKGLMDTGNLLCDPIYGKPVVVMSNNGWVDEMLKKYPQRHTAVIFSNINTQKGIMSGIRIDRIVIKNANDIYQMKNITVAVGDMLKDNKEYELLLNAKLCENN